jgi:O-antigen/teichoic acid export membrane protein
LGPDGRGIFAIASVIGAAGIQFGNFGLHSSNTYYVAKDKNLLSALISNSILVSFLFGSAVILIGLVISDLKPNLLPINGIILIEALLYIPFGLAYLLLQNILIGINEIKAYNKIELITKIVYPILILLLVLGRHISPETVFFMSMLSIVAGLVWVIYRLRKITGIEIKISKNILKISIKYGLKAYLAAMFSFLVLRVDLLMVKQLLGAEETGYYSIAVSISDLLLMLPIVIGTILFPNLSSLKNDEERWQKTKKIIFLFIPITISMIIIAGLFAKPFILLLYGKQFLFSVSPFIWLLPGVFFMSINTIFMNYFASTGMPLITIYSSGSAAVLNIILNLYTIPSYGIIGASISSTIAYSAMLIFSLIYINFKRRVIHIGGL